KHEHAGKPVHNGERLFGKVAEKAHVVVQLVTVDGAAKRSVFRDLVPDQHQLQVVETALSYDLKRVDQSLEVFVRLHVPRVQDKVRVQLVAFADPVDGFLIRLDAETWIERVIDHVDLAGRDVDEALDVSLGALRHGQHARRPLGGQRNRRARIGERPSIGQVLRK